MHFCLHSPCGWVPLNATNSIKSNLEFLHPPAHHQLSSHVDSNSDIIVNPYSLSSYTHSDIIHRTLISHLTSATSPESIFIATIFNFLKYNSAYTPLPFKSVQEPTLHRRLTANSLAWHGKGFKVLTQTVTSISSPTDCR